MVTDDDLAAIEAAAENGLGVVNAARALRVVAEVARLRTEQSAGGCWIAYYSDWSGFVIFDDELACLRHAVEGHMEASWVPFGVDPREHVAAR